MPVIFSQILDSVVPKFVNKISWITIHMLFIISEAKHSELLDEFEISSEAVERGVPSLESSNTGEGFLVVHVSLSMHFVAGLMP